MEYDESDTGERAGRLEQALVEYMRAIDAGQGVDREAFIRKHSVVAEELREYFANLDALEGLVEERDWKSVETKPAQSDLAESPPVDSAAETRTYRPGGRGSSVPRRRIGKFELTEMLGQGAFGTVFRARDLELGREVAIKTPRTGILLSAVDEERFLGEGKSAAKLRHPCIVPVYEVGRDEGLLYIASEYVDGITLRELLQVRRLSFCEAAEVAFQIALALKHAHKHGVIHRDLKPANIMMETVEADGDQVEYESGVVTSGPSSWSSRVGSNRMFRARPAYRPRLMDFGLARRTDSEVTLTMEGATVGTPVYMSPEQARGDSHSVDGRCDVYSLGVVLYQLLTGELPFRGSARMVLLQVLDDDPRPPRQLDDTIPRDLETITLRCMEKDPARRFSSAGEVASELHRFLHGVPIRARPVSRGERAWKWCRRNPIVTAAATVTFLALSFGLVVSLVGYVQVSRAFDKKDLAETEAQQSLQDAQQVVHDFLVTVAKEDLVNRPGMQSLQLELLDRAATYFNGFEDRSSATLAVRLMSAENLYGFATLAHALGKNRESHNALDRSVEILERLATSHPADPEVLRRLGEAHTQLGNVLDQEKAYEEATRAYERALRTRRQLCALYPEEAAEPRRQLANAIMNDALARKSKAAELTDKLTKKKLLLSAINDMIEAQKIRSQLVESGMADGRIRFDHAQGNYNLADAKRRLAETDEANRLVLEADGVDLIRQAIEGFRRLLEDQIGGIDLIETEYNLLVCRRVNTDWYALKAGTGELVDYSVILQDLQHLVDKNPAMAVYRFELVETHLSAALAARATTAAACASQLRHVHDAESLLIQPGEPRGEERKHRAKLTGILERIVATRAAQYDAHELAADELTSAVEAWHEQLRRLVELDPDNAKANAELDKASALLQYLTVEPSQDEPASPRQ